MRRSDVSDLPGSPRRFPQGRSTAPPGACELLLVRHGQSEDAVEGVPFVHMAGRADPPLSESGRNQADRVCAHLGTEHIDAVYVTSLRRTVETAAPLVTCPGIEPQGEHDLREIYLGEWEGTANAPGTTPGYLLGICLDSTWIPLAA